MWKNQTWLILDGETTGLKAADERIIEIGAILMRGGQILDRFNALCNPQKALQPIITTITGINDAMLATAPLFSAHIERLNSLAEQADVFVAYNSDFDQGFYEEEYKRANTEFTKRHWLDPLVFARKLDELPHNKLTEVCARYRIKVENAHRADGDAEMTAQLMLELAQRLPDDLQQLLELQRLWRAQQDAAYRARKFAKQNKTSGSKSS